MFDVMEIVVKYISIIDSKNSDMFDELLHELVASELLNNDIKNGLLLKASIAANGDQDKSKIIYAKLRIEQLRNEICSAAKIYNRVMEERRVKAKQIAEENKRMAIESYNEKHNVCQYCCCITDKETLICPRCHLPL